jgi:hypothetical protein
MSASWDLGHKGDARGGEERAVSGHGLAFLTAKDKPKGRREDGPPEERPKEA